MLLKILLSLSGYVVSDIVEDLFLDDPKNETSPKINTDGESTGTNHTGNYSVLMKLDTNIPQLLPMAGRRVKIYYRGVKRLCTRCFEKHH